MSNSKKDNPSDAKRPHATLDLKAEDVTAAGKEPEKKAASSDKASAAAGPTDQTKASEPGKADVKDKDASTAKAEGKDSAKGTPPPARTSGAGIFSHVLAGIAGGVFAVAAAEWVAPYLGVTTPAQDLKTQTWKLERRLAAVEQSNGTQAVSGELSAVDKRIADLETQTASLSKTQQAIAQETQDALKEASSAALSEATEKRLDALDQRLATIAKGAQDGASEGGISQLVAVSGKLSDVQTSLTKEIDQVRRSMPQNVESRIREAAKDAVAARAGTQRLSGDISGLKTEAARLEQRIETLKADSERDAAKMQVLQEEAAKLSSEFSELKSTVSTQVKGGVGEAIDPLSKKLAALEDGLAAVIKSEEERRTNAERIVVSLQLANLKRLVDSGQPYTDALSKVRDVAGGKLDLSPLGRFQGTGVATIGELRQEFRPVANAVIDAAEMPEKGGVIDKLVAGAKSIVRVRNLNPTDDDKSASAVVSRMQNALTEGRLGEVLEHAKTIPPAASGPAQDWLTKVEARHAVDDAIGQIEDQLEASLTSDSPGEPSEAGAADGNSPANDSSAERLPAPGSVRPETPAPLPPSSPETAQP